MSRATLQTIYKPFSSMPWKPKDAGVHVLSVHSYNYLLVLATHLCVQFVFVMFFKYSVCLVISTSYKIDIV